MSISPANVTAMLTYMLSRIGHPYSENTSLRLGPTYFDCSGLVYKALTSAGIPIPQSDDIASLEANWLGTQQGVQVIKNASDIKTGDVVFFTGASPDPSNYGPIGHVGMAADSKTLVSAYDTAMGVTKTPISQDQFVVAMRLNGANITDNSGSGSQGGLGGLLQFPSQITTFFHDANDFVTAILWLTKPSNWLRIGAFLIGIGLLLFAIHAFVKTGTGEPLTGGGVPIPVPI